MQSGGKQQPGDGITLRGSFNLFYLVINGLATTLTPFLRTNFGSEALGFNGVAALVIILAYFTAYPSVGVAHFFWYWFLAMIVQRCRTFWLHWRGRHPHSRYIGDPWLAVVFKNARVDYARFLEPVFCGLIALYVMPSDPWLARLLLWAAGGLLLSLLMDHYIENKRIQRLRDAEIDQRFLVRRYARHRQW